MEERRSGWSPDGEGCVVPHSSLPPKRAFLRASIHMAAWVPPKTLGPNRMTAVPPTWYKRDHRLVTQHEAELEISLST